MINNGLWGRSTKTNVEEVFKNGGVQSKQETDSLYFQQAIAVKNEITKVIKGKDDVVEKVLMAMFASGHILLEDHPGTGKTTLAKTIARVIDMNYHRQQFTPDTMPTDIIGYTMYDSRNDIMRYVPGVVLCNLLLADEINRTSAKTQAALLEAMEEKTVTVEGETHALPLPFVVIATQNPVTSIGTQPLPDSECDRFIIKISMGYPEKSQEKEILKDTVIGDKTILASTIINSEQFNEICKHVDELFVNDQLLEYICDLVDATRNNDYIEVGVSPRGAIALKRMASAHAFFKGREYVVPEDVEAVFADVVNHRIILNSRARMEDKTEFDVIKIILNSVRPAKVTI